MTTFMPTRRQVLATRAHRHHLTPSSQGSSDSDYLAAIGELGPMRPPSYEFPGTPVVLFDRHADASGSTPQEVAERVRRQRLVFKGRFQGGRVAYVRAEDVPLYLAAFRRERIQGDAARRVLSVLESEGPLHKTDLAEVSGVKGRDLSAALQKLQEAFLVFEGQVETEWDNAWFSVEREQPEWLAMISDSQSARAEVLRRFARAYVATSAQEVKEWSGFPKREVQRILDSLVQAGQLVEATVAELGPRYLVSDWEPMEAEQFVAILDPGDPLVCAVQSSLKRKFEGLPALKYVDIDGEIVGMATGRWGIGPFDIDDVVFPDGAPGEPIRGQAIEKLRRHFPSPRHRIRSFGGVPLDGTLV